MTDITLPRAELQQVLEAMENFGTDWDGWHRAYMALRERLAQPEQEPAPVQQEPAIQASIRRTSMGGLVGNVYWVNDRLAEGYYTLYTSTPAQRQPLTDEELYKIFPAIATYTEANKTLYRSIARATEAAHGIKGEA